MGSNVDTAEERDTKRSAVARTQATARNEIEQQYIKDKNELEAQYLKDLESVNRDWSTAYVEEGLNPDGSDPRNRPQGGGTPAA